MVYFMPIFVDGGCRNNGKEGAIAAAVAIHKFRTHWNRKYSQEKLWLKPTSSRAELAAIILALKMAIQRQEHAIHRRMKVVIYSDSRYAVDTMNEWKDKWVSNGWITANRTPVANQDLVKELIRLESELEEYAKVKYVHIPRQKNKKADGLCNDVLDNMEHERQDKSTALYLGGVQLAI